MDKKNNICLRTLFFISYPELFLYKYVSRETLKRSEDKHIHFNSVLSRI